MPSSRSPHPAVKKSSRSHKAVPISTDQVQFTSHVEEVAVPKKTGVKPAQSAETNVSICPYGRGFAERPKDEIAMLRNGFVDRSAQRCSYGLLETGLGPGVDASPLYDELELANHGLHEARNGQRLVGEPIAVDQTPPHYYSKHGVELRTEPITTAELNSRGFADEQGKLHYSVSSILRAESTRQRHALNPVQRYPPPNRAENQRFESKSISNNTDRQSRTLQADDTIACEVGRGANPAKLTYTITRDGRSYDLDDVKLKRCIHLSYNKKNALLLSLHN